MSPLSVVIIYHLIVISGVAASSLRTVQCGLPFSALGVGTAAVEPSPDTSLLSDDEYLDYNVWTCVLPDLPVTLTSATLSLDLEPESWAQLPDHPPVLSIPGSPLVLLSPTVSQSDCCLPPLPSTLSQRAISLHLHHSIHATSITLALDTSADAVMDTHVKADRVLQTSTSRTATPSHSPSKTPSPTVTPSKPSKTPTISLTPTVSPTYSRTAHVTYTSSKSTSTGSSASPAPSSPIASVAVSPSDSTTPQASPSAAGGGGGGAGSNPSSTSSASPSNGTVVGSTSSVSSAEIAGIAVGASVAVIIAVAVVIFFVWRRKEKKEAAKQTPPVAIPSTDPANLPVSVAPTPTQPPPQQYSAVNHPHTSAVAPAAADDDDSSESSDGGDRLGTPMPVTDPWETFNHRPGAASVRGKRVVKKHSKLRRSRSFNPLGDKQYESDGVVLDRYARKRQGLSRFGPVGSEYGHGMRKHWSSGRREPGGFRGDGSGRSSAALRDVHKSSKWTDTDSTASVFSDGHPLGARSPPGSQLASVDSNPVQSDNSSSAVKDFETRIVKKFKKRKQELRALGSMLGKVLAEREQEMSGPKSSNSTVSAPPASHSQPSPAVVPPQQPPPPYPPQQLSSQSYQPLVQPLQSGQPTQAYLGYPPQQQPPQPYPQQPQRPYPSQAQPSSVSHQSFDHVPTAASRSRSVGPVERTSGRVYIDDDSLDSHRPSTVTVTTTTRRTEAQPQQQKIEYIIQQPQQQQQPTVVVLTNPSSGQQQEYLMLPPPVATTTTQPQPAPIIIQSPPAAQPQYIVVPQQPPPTTVTQPTVYQYAAQPPPPPAYPPPPPVEYYNEDDYPYYAQSAVDTLRMPRPLRTPITRPRYGDSVVGGYPDSVIDVDYPDRDGGVYEEDRASGGRWVYEVEGVDADGDASVVTAPDAPPIRRLRPSSRAIPVRIVTRRKRRGSKGGGGSVYGRTRSLSAMRPPAARPVKFF